MVVGYHHFRKHPFSPGFPGQKKREGCGNLLHLIFVETLCEVPVDLIEEAAMMVCAPQINTLASNVAGDFAEKFSVARGFEVRMSKATDLFFFAEI